jgi:hypothetical protein
LFVFSLLVYDITQQAENSHMVITQQAENSHMIITQQAENRKMLVLRPFYVYKRRGLVVKKIDFL